MDAVLMTVPPGIAPRTRGGDWGVVMFHTSGKGEKTQWFDFRHSMYDSPVHAEWPLGSMMATLPAEIAEVLVEHRDGSMRWQRMRWPETYTLKTTKEDAV